MADKLTLGIVIGASLAGSVGSAFKSLDGKIKQTAGVLDKAKLGQKLAGDVIKYRREIEQLEGYQKQFGLSNTRLWGQLAKSEQHYRKAAKAAEKYGLNVGDIVRQHRQLGDSAAAAERKLARLRSYQANRDKRANIQGQLLGTLGAAYAVGTPIRQASRFEADLRDTAITGGFAGSAQETELGKVIRAEAIRTAQSVGALNQGVNALVAGGIQSVAELKAYVPTLGQAATAWNADMEDLSALALSTKEQFGIAAKDLKGALNILGTAGKDGQFEVKDMAKWMPALGAQLKGLGLTGKKGLAEAGAWLQIARMGAGSSDAAANNFQNFLSKVTSPDTQKDFKKAGIDLEKSQRKLMQKGHSAIESTLIIIEEYMGKQGPDAVKNFKTLLSSKDDAERESALRRLNEAYKLGELFQDMQAMSFIRPALANMQTRKDITDKAMAAENGPVLDNDFALKMATNAKLTDQFNARIGELGIVLGNVLLPGINQVLGVVGGVSGEFGELAERFPTMTKVVVGAAVGLVGLKVAALATGYAATLISDGWQLAKGMIDFFRLSTLRANTALVANKVVTMGLTAGQRLMAAGTALVTTAQWAWNAALTANPIGLVIAGVAAFAALAYTVYQNWAPISLWIGDNVFTPIAGIAEQASGLVVQAFDVASGLVRSAWSSISAWFGETFAAIGGFAGTAQTAIGSALDAAAASVRAVWESVVNWFGAKLTWISEKVDWIKGVSGSLFGKGSVVGAALNVFAAPATTAPIPVNPPVVIGPAAQAVNPVVAPGAVMPAKPAASHVSVTVETAKTAPARSLGRPVSDRSARPVAPMAGTIGEVAGKTARPMPLATPAMPNMPEPRRNAQTIQHTSTQHNTFHITQNAGEDGKALAKRVAEELARKQASDQRRSLHD